MSRAYVSLQPQSAIRRLPPTERIAALADGGKVIPLDSSRPSPYLARFGVTAQEDDGIATASYLALALVKWFREMRALERADSR